MSGDAPEGDDSTLVPSHDRTLQSPHHPAAPLALEQVGQTVGQFELLKLMGEGSMGRVFQARHTRLGRLVALKLLRPEHVSDPELVQRFFQEAQTVNQINHEHIVEIIDFVAERGEGGVSHAYCVMELLSGSSLADTLRQEPLSLQRTGHIGKQLCMALAAAHETGVVHRDIKPDNIFLIARNGARDYVKVLDFGVAKLLRPVGDLPAGGTAHGAIIGTPTYMAPEQALGMSVDERSDIYAVGVVLYEALTGQVPFAGASFGALVVQIATEAPPPLPVTNRVGEAIPAGLRSLVERCLSKKPEERPATMRALATELSRYTGELGPLEPEPVILPPRRLGARTLAAALATGAVALGLAVHFRPVPAVELVPVPVVAVAPPKPAPRPVRPARPAPPLVATLSIDSVPTGVRVLRGDTHELLGETPLHRTVDAAATASLRFEREGYAPEERQVRLEGTTQLSVALTPLPAAPRRGTAPRSNHAPADGTAPLEGVIDELAD